MTRSRFNQAKHHMGNGNNLTLSKVRGLFLEDNDNIDMKDTYKITKKMLLIKCIVTITYYPLLIK